MFSDLWTTRFMTMARIIASWSKHPTTQVGCVAIDDEKRQMSGGFNGLPRGCNDARLLDQSRASSTVHAEANAVAAAARPVMKGTSVFVTEPPCAQCTALLIQAGVIAIYYKPNPEMAPKWVESFKEAQIICREAGVDLQEWK